MLHFRTTTQELLRTEGTIVPHVRPDDSCVRVRLGIFHNLSVKMLLGTSIFDRFMHGIFPSDQKSFRGTPTRKQFT